MADLVLSDLFIYPIKSAAGIRVEAASLTGRGLDCDRTYMVVTPSGHFMTQRRFPRMALINVQLTVQMSSPTGLLVSAPDMPALHVSVPVLAEPSKPVVEVDVWADHVSALSCGAAAADWFSQFLGTACQLVYMPDSTQRPTDHGKFGSDELVSFADAYPYLLLSEASLTGLNQKLSAQQLAPVTMDRFRPNLVVKGDIEPHAEDSWQRIRIGDAVFTVAKPCARCSVPNVNQQTGQRTTQTSQTLATYRTWDKKIWFGQNLIQENSGPSQLKRGDTIEVLAVR